MNADTVKLEDLEAGIHEVIQPFSLEEHKITSEFIEPEHLS